MKKSVKQSRQVIQARRLARFLIWLLILTVLGGLLGCYFIVLKPEKRYVDAEKQLESKAYTKAAQMFSAIDGYRDSSVKALASRCLGLFEIGEVESACDMYLALDADTQEQVRQTVGSFETLGNSALENGDYSKALYFFRLIPEGGPEETLYALDVYNEAAADIENGSYADGREKARLVMGTSDIMDAPLQQLIDDSYEKEYRYYEQLGESDLDSAAKGMESMQDEYEPAGKYLKDRIMSFYEWGVKFQDEGKYEDAIDWFEKILTYGDCRLKISQCRVMLYEAQAQAGEIESALEGVMSLYDWENAIFVLPDDSVLLPRLDIKEDNGETSTDDEEENEVA
ncbi:MAG: hypothetical protein K5663_11570 [Clostridiales bacterium]|nr:hypothetical protein [Clostridiales bacterium]